MSRMASVETRLYHVPLAEVLVDAKHGAHTHFELITTTIELEDGRSGTGYSYTGGKGGHSIVAMIEHDLVPVLVGRDAADVEAVHEELGWHVHYVGRGGVSSFAIAAVDIALWDLRCKGEGLPLWQVIGGTSDRCRAYGGGIDLGFDMPKLLRNIDGYLARGFDAVKIKVGKDDLDEDVARVRAVREHIGPDIAFMVDANYAMDVPGAKAAAAAFAPYDLLWFEEPIDPDDLDGYREIAGSTDLPLAMGENQHTIHEFEAICRDVPIGFLQPDAATCGGITTWLRAAALARENDIVVCSHGMHELHVSLLAAQPDAGWLEVHSFPIDEYTTRPIIVEEHLAVAPSAPGTGVTFEWDRLAPHRVLP